MSDIKSILKFIGAAVKDVMKNGFASGFVNRVLTNVVCGATTFVRAACRRGPGPRITTL